MMMQPPSPSVKDHYDRFLAGQYVWMAGGFAINLERNRRLFSEAGIIPRSTGTAIDLGAGCGFAAIPLAGAGFRVTAVDFCRPLLDELVRHTPEISTVEGDILDFPLWAGRGPELIVCMGDTLTHLPDTGSVRNLLRQCDAELVPGGKFILALRDYSAGERGETVVIPVRRDTGQIFLCRLEYGDEKICVTDIVYSNRAGKWERNASSYEKIRFPPGSLIQELEHAGLQIDEHIPGEGLITIIAEKIQE
ncbi:MAG TPA: class I SAM-dependent methyltransferase [Methanoregula sp.]|nr:class I SAM-dependent methyltransferase [Methanoregula sp.]